VKLESSFKGEKEPRGVVYWPGREEIYVTHDTGLLSVYGVSNLEKGPIRKLSYIFKVLTVFRLRQCP
jgi:hypothetical protein